MHTENGQTNQTIKEVTEMLGISKSLIRFWEEEFDLPRLGNGVLSPLEIEQIKVINHLITEREMSLDDAKRTFSFERERLTRKHKTLDRLIEIRQSLVGLKNKITENGSSSE